MSDYDFSGNFGDFTDFDYKSSTQKSGSGSALTDLIKKVGGVALGVKQLFGGGATSSADAISELAKEGAEELNKIRDEYEGKFDQRLANIYPGLTGLTAQDAMSKYYDAFADTVSRVSDAGLLQLGVNPDISRSYGRLGDRVGDIQQQYSLAERLPGGFEGQVLDPSVVKMDYTRLARAGDRFLDDPEKYKETYAYLNNPQTSRFIYGSSPTADAIGEYYNTSGDVAGLMNYGSVG